MTCSAFHGCLGRVLVLGLGKTGEAVVRYCLAIQNERRVTSVVVYTGLEKGRPSLVGDLRRAGVLVVEGTECVVGSYDVMVVSPGIAVDSPFYRSGAAACAEVIGEPELAWRESPDRWIAITGTNGKTTTTLLTHDLLTFGGIDAEAVGNVGTPCIARVAKRREREWFIAELSSFQLATSRELHPRVGVLLNITSDHIAWHGSFAAYVAAKERVFAHLSGDDLGIVGVDDQPCQSIAKRAIKEGKRLCCVSLERALEGPDAAFIRRGHLVVRLNETEHALVKTSVLMQNGLYNYADVLAAATIALHLGVSSDVVSERLHVFSSLKHRMELVGEVRGVRFINDSKATNVDATKQALAVLGRCDHRNIVLLLGGHDKKTSLAPLMEYVARYAKAIICFGEAAERFVSAFAEKGEVSGVVLVHASNLADAFAHAVQHVVAGDVVLLSPACSSFDEFSDYKKRGMCFKHLYQAYADDKDRP